MSRTDVHRPGWVQEREPTLRRHMVARHYHWLNEYDLCTHEPPCRGHVRLHRYDDRPYHLVRHPAACDLHLFEAAKGRKVTRCQLVYRGGRNIYCGCRGCTGHDERRQRRRRERADGRAVCRAALADAQNT
jgi:hypothetical protein